MNVPSLGLLVCLCTMAVLAMAACGEAEIETSTPSSTASVTSTSATAAAGDESVSTESVADGGESVSTESVADGESTSSETTVATTIPDSSSTIGSGTTSSEPSAASSGPTPWSAAPLELADLPDVYRLEWAEAGEPASCPFLAFADLGPEAAEASIRRGEHDRNMLVVWDNPDGPGHDRRSEPCSDCGRGVVGLGTWQNGEQGGGSVTISWDDGSVANIDTLPWVYGVSARIRPAGADCIYQLWSHIGFEHVEYLISQLRLVQI